MENASNYWYYDEDQQLKKLFSKYKMDISEIAQIHKRSVNAIKCRLIALGLIDKKNETPENKSLSEKIDAFKERIDVLESKVKSLTERLEVSGLD